jgi:hypothetical protein
VGASTLAIDTTEHDDNGIRPDEAIMVRYHPLRREFSLAEGSAPGTHSYLGSLAAAFSAGFVAVGFQNLAMASGLQFC